MSRPSRGDHVGRALELIGWLRGRRAPFKSAQVAEVLGVSMRTAIRWLNVAEGHGLVESVRTDRDLRKWRWRSTS